MCTDAEINEPGLQIHSAWHVTVENSDYAPVNFSVEVIPSWEKKSLHSLAVALLAIMQGPANIPFKPRVGGGRKRPSISWLVENIYDWPVPQRSLAGRAPTGESKTAQNTNDAWSVLVRGYSWDKETDWAMQIASWCWSEWISSGVWVLIQQKKTLKKHVIAQLWFPACLLPLITWFTTGTVGCLVDQQRIYWQFWYLLIICAFKLV